MIAFKTGLSFTPWPPAARLNSNHFEQLAVILCSKALLTSTKGTAVLDGATEALAADFGKKGRLRGDIILGLQASGAIERAGDVPSRRPRRCAPRIGLWRLVDRTAALVALHRRRRELRESVNGPVQLRLF